MAKLVENRAAPHCGFPDNQVGNNRCSIEIHRAEGEQREGERERRIHSKRKTRRETLRPSDALNS